MKNVNEMSEQEWKTLPGSNGNVEVSSVGEVRAKTYRNGNRGEPCNSWRLLPQWVGSTGYMRVNIPGRGTVLSHHIVMESHVGPRPSGADINHKDCCKTNNTVDNLEYVSRSENMRHAASHGLLKKIASCGERHGHAKLTDSAVIDIRTSELSGVELARKYNVTPTAICSVRRRRAWNHI